MENTPQIWNEENTSSLVVAEIWRLSAESERKKQLSEGMKRN